MSDVNEGRRAAEAKIEPILASWSEAELALLVHLLALLGWTRDRARGVLQAVHWWV